MSGTALKSRRSDALRSVKVNDDLYFLASDVEDWHRNHMALSEAAAWVVEHFTDDTGHRPLPACLVALEAALG